MSDERLIGYCDIHSDTERALFNGIQIKRMFVLAGRKASNIADDSWYSMHDSMKKLVKEARERGWRPKLVLVP